MHAEIKQIKFQNLILYSFIGLLVLIGLSITVSYNYLLFHSLVEIFSILVAFGVFVVGWNSVEFTENRFYLFIGVAYLCIGFLDFIHTLAYKGMGVFLGFDANLPTQLWIAARYLESGTLLAAPLVMNKNFSKAHILTLYLLSTSILITSIFYWKIFPDCYIEGFGLTPFKIMSEYIISGILLAAAVVYQLKKGSFEPFVRRLMIMSILITISAEMAFTLYVDVYGYFNMIGHYLKLLSFCLIYKAIIQMSLIKPYQVLFKDLKDREQILSHRTSQLETSNRELEAFSFSVSHDLRAPLRNIDGYSRVLLEDYSNEVDDQCKHYLTRIRVSTERMSHLIDDLLKFSRLSRAPLHKQMVKISALAHEIVKELHESEPERSVNFEIEEGITAFGDKRLLIVVITNLLSNAWKFTRKHATAHIEVGVNKTNGKTVYFVRDDGAGFDMKYVDKLFGPFQRLHKIDEFEGTGIGLATAQRIIHRHGGTIWAESVVEQGATFYFTLGTEDEKDE